MAQQSPKELYLAIPPVTRAWITAAVATSVFEKLGFLSPMMLSFIPWPIWHNFEVRQRGTRKRGAFSRECVSTCRRPVH